MDREEIEARLRTLGLDESEAEAYVELYLRGPCQAGEIAEALNVHRTKGYWAMENLVRKEFARQLASAPTRYEARDPREIGPTTQRAARDPPADVDRIRDGISAALQDLRDDEPGPDGDDDYRILRGRPAVREILDDAFDRMEEQLLVFSTGPWAKVTRASYPGLWQKAIELAQEQVQVRAIFNTSPEMRQELRGLLQMPRIDVRHLATKRQRPFVVVDRREVMYWLVVDPSTEPDAEDEVAVWTDADDFARDLEMTFVTAWEDGSALGARPDTGSWTASSDDA